MKKISTAFMVLIAAAAFGQWNPDISQNLQVSSAKANIGELSKTADGKSYVFYFEENSTDFFIPKLQLLDSDGQKLFPEDGVDVNPVAKFSTYYKLMDQTVDKLNNFYVLFSGTGDSNLYLSKVTPAGTRAWGDGGKILDNGSINFPRLAVTPTGIVAAYTKGNKGYLQKYDPETGAKVWEQPVEVSSPFSNLSKATINELAVLSDGSIVTLNLALGNGINGKWFAQRYDSDGATMWTEPAVLSSTTGVQSNIGHDYLVDSNDNVFVSYFTSGISGSKFDAFVQRVDTDGTLPWGDHGKAVSNSEYFEKTTRITMKGNDIYAVTAYTNSTQGQSGIMTQRFNKNTGEILLSPQGNIIYPMAPSAEGNIISGRLDIVDGKPVFLKENHGIPTNNPTIVSAVVLDESGNVEKTIPVSSSNLRARTNFISHGTQGVALWSDKRDPNTPRLYAQNFTLGSLGLINVTKQAASVYPNPVKHVLNIKSDKKISSNQIMDLTGKIVLRNTADKIDMSTLPRGNYILTTVFEDHSIVTRKIIKE